MGKRFRDMSRDEREALVARSVAQHGEGYIYLIEMERPLGDPQRPRCSARFYLGWAIDPVARLAQHRAGQGSRMLAAAAAQGISFHLVGTWRGTHHDEYRLKRAGHFDKLAARVRGLNATVAVEAIAS